MHAVQHSRIEAARAGEARSEIERKIVIGVTEAAKFLSTDPQSLKTRVDEFLIEVRAI